MMTERRQPTYFILAIMTVFLLVNRYMTIEIGVLAILFLGGFSRENHIMRFDSLEKSVGAIAAFTAIDILLSQIPGFSSLFSLQESITEIERAVIYILIIQIIASVRVDIRSYCRIWRFILIVVVGVCVIQYLKPFNIDSYLKRFYGDTVQFLNSAQTDIDAFRGGSVFVNPNFMACFLVAYLGNYLALMRVSRERILLVLINFILVITGLVLSGSRTGLTIGGLEFLLYFILNTRNKGKKGLFRLLLALAILLALLSVFASDLGSALGGLRAFQFNDGLNNSLSSKIKIWLSVMSQAGGGNYLFGYGPYDYAADPGILVDFELGYFTVFYGVVGVFLYIGLVRSIMRHNTRSANEELQKRRNLFFALVMFLFGFTSGVYLNLRMFSIFIVLFLPTILNAAGDPGEQIRSS